jgi:DNA-binding response OmpR family regulator
VLSVHLAGNTGANGGPPVLRAGSLEIRPAEGLATAAGRALRLSVREFGLLTELARSEGRIVRREDLYERVWQQPLRSGDRTIDVYVRRLRVKLEQAVPDVRFIHTHVGFGYRFAPERSQSFHTDATSH